MELVQHIRDLLYHNDCVIVPGFGGFVTNERSARIDGVSNIFYPPSREVGFNARLDHNDGLLISYISSRLSVNYVDAKNLTDSFAAGVTRKLTAGRTVHFEGIGQFSSDRQNNLQFEPDPSANFLIDAYGLSLFRFPALAARESARRKKSFYENDSSPVRARMRKLLRYAAVGIPLIAALTWGAMNTSLIREYNFDLSTLNPFGVVFNSPSEIQTGTVSPGTDSTVEEKLEDMSSMRRALMYKETVAAEKENAAVDNEMALAEEVQVIENEDAGRVAAGAAKVDEPVPVSVARSSHYIVAGSFASSKNAMVLRDRLEKQGYQCEIFESEKGMFRVTLFSSDNSREALKVLREMRAESSNQDIWMLSI